MLSPNRPRALSWTVGSGTRPLGQDTATVRFSPGARARVVSKMTVWFSRNSRAALSREPGGPVQATVSRTSPGGSMTARTCSRGRIQPLPVTFQLSSSWSAKKPTCREVT